jgi:hypothetical protein
MGLTDLEEADILAAGEGSAPRGTLTLTAPVTQYAWQYDARSACGVAFNRHNRSAPAKRSFSGTSQTALPAELFHLVRCHRVRRIGFRRRHEGTALAASVLGQLRKQTVHIQTGRGEQAPNFGDGLASELRHAGRLGFRFRRRIGNQYFRPWWTGRRLRGLGLDQA